MVFANNQLTTKFNKKSLAVQYIIGMSVRVWENQLQNGKDRQSTKISHYMHGSTISPFFFT